MSTPGSRLRRDREARGLSLEDVSAATRIPVEHLTALEEDRVEDLPAGPYAAAYRKKLARMGIGARPTRRGATPSLPPEVTAEVPLPSPPDQLSTSTLRRVAGLAALGAVALVAGLAAWQSGLDPSDITPVPVVDPPDQSVKIVARRTTPIVVRIDHEVAFDGQLAGGDERVFVGRDRVEVEVPATGAARFEYNGRTVVPQGRQDAPRKLVFIDDLGGER